MTLHSTGHTKHPPGDLAAAAASPMRQMPLDTTPIKSLWPVYGEDEIAAVSAVLQSGRVNSLVHGDECRAFEREFAAACDMPFGISLANGTLALELALRALGVGAGDEVIVPCRSFVASASCVVTCGATPVFADVDRESQNISPKTIAAALTERTKAIIAVHLAGYPCAMEEICELAHARGVFVIEDCAQAHGARLAGRPIGSFGDAAAFSFCTDKIMSTGGEGGMLLLRHENVWAAAWSFKDHGKNYNLAIAKVAGSTFRYIHTECGSNYRMTEMQAAIGRCQLRKLPEWTAQRRKRAEILQDILHAVPAIRLPVEARTIEHAYYKFYAFVRPERLKAGWSRDRIVQAAQAAGLPCQSGSCPEIYREEAFTSRGLGLESPLPVAQELGMTSLMLPIDQTLSESDVARMGRVLAEIVQAASA